MSNRNSPLLQPSEVPVTQAMLFGVRDELAHRISSAEGKNVAQHLALNHRIDEKFEILDRRIDALEHKIDIQAKEASARHSELQAAIVHLGVIVEEQNARNRLVLEGLSGLFTRQERIETRMDSVESLVAQIARAAKRNGPRAQ